MARRGRRVQAERRTDFCDILRDSGGADSEGGQGTSFATMYADVPCRVVDSGMPPFELQRGDRVVSVVQVVFNLDPDQDVTEKDRILYAGFPYQVLSVNPVTNMHSKYARAYKII